MGEEKKQNRIRSITASDERRDQNLNRARRLALYSTEVKQASSQELRLLEWGIVVGESPIHVLQKKCPVYFTRVAFPGTGALNWWYIPSTSEYCLELNSRQVP